MAVVNTVAASIAATLQVQLAKAEDGCTATIGGVTTTLPAITDPSNSVNLSNAIALVNGVAGAGNVNKAFTAQRPALPTTTSESFDLTGNASFVNCFGDEIDMTYLKAIFIINQSTTNSLIIGGANNVPFLSTAGTVTIRPGGALLLFTGLADATGYPVTNSTGDLITVTAGAIDATAVPYQIILLGVG